jgi:hypothetical protein
MYVFCRCRGIEKWRSLRVPGYNNGNNRERWDGLIRLKVRYIVTRSDSSAELLMAILIPDTYPVLAISR